MKYEKAYPACEEIKSFYPRLEKRPPLTELEKFQILEAEVARFHDTDFATTGQIESYLKFKEDKKELMSDVRQIQAELNYLVREINRITPGTKESMKELKERIERIKNC